VLSLSLQTLTDTSVALAFAALLRSVWIGLRVSLPLQGDPLRRLKRARFWLESMLLLTLPAHFILPERLTGPDDVAISATLIVLALATFVNGTIALRGSDQVRRLAVAEKEALTDPLTGLHNRRFFKDRVETELAKAIRNGTSLSLLALDLDHFKSINDRYGHAVGDSVLVDFAETLQRGIRPGDLVARFGGEEFVVAAPNTDGDGAMALAERLRQATANRVFVAKGHETPINVTVSIGVASVRDQMPTPAAILARADQALYDAKKSGRNRVVLRHDSHVERALGSRAQLNSETRALGPALSTH